MPKILENLKTAAENAVVSYETKLESVGEIFDNAYEVLDNFQEDVLSNKEARRKTSILLCNTLSRSEHLRKKDFDSMTQDVLSAQEVREVEVKDLLKSYLNQQRGMARTLKENLGKFKNALTKGDLQRVKEFQEMNNEALANLDARKNEVSGKLKEFQKEQQEMAERLKALQAKGRDLRIKDLKEMFQGFRAQQKERLTQRMERRQEINKIMGRVKTTS